MQAHPDLPNVIHSQKAILARYGEAIWCDITDTVRLGQLFNIHSLINQLPSISHLKYQTQRNYIRLVLKNVHLTNPETLGRLGGKTWIL